MTGPARQSGETEATGIRMSATQWHRVTDGELAE
jgi:hypothetical protein